MHGVEPKSIDCQPFHWCITRQHEISSCVLSFRIQISPCLAPFPPHLASSSGNTFRKTLLSHVYCITNYSSEASGCKDGLSNSIPWHHCRCRRQLLLRRVLQILPVRLRERQPIPRCFSDASATHVQRNSYALVSSQNHKQ